jgi:hypothetical protein
MQWVSDLWAGDSRFAQIAIIAVCAIAVLVALAIVYRVVFAHRLRVPGGRTRQPRLGLVDAFSLDGQRQLVLVRRDNVEHLVMIGGPNDILIEAQINRGLAPSRETSAPVARPTAPSRRRAEPAVTPSPAAQPPAAAVAAPIPSAEVHPIPVGVSGKEETHPAPAVSPSRVSGPPAMAPAVVATVEAAQLASGRSQPVSTRRVMPAPITPLGRANFARLPEKAAETAASAAHAVSAAGTSTEKVEAAPDSNKPEPSPQPAGSSAEPAQAKPRSGPAGSHPATGQQGWRPVEVKSEAQGAAAQPAASLPQGLAAAAAPHPSPTSAPPLAADMQTPAQLRPTVEVKSEIRPTVKPAAPIPASVAVAAAPHPGSFAPSFRADAQPITARPEGPAQGPQSPIKADIQDPLKPVAASAPSGVSATAAPHPAPGAPSRMDGRSTAPAPADVSSQGSKAEPKVDGPLPPAASSEAEKHAHSADDPFAGLDSLEAEMAKLLGAREAELRLASRPRIPRPRSFVAVDLLAALVALLSFDRKSRDWPGVEAAQRDGLARLHAIAVGTVLDTGDSGFNLGDQLALAVTRSQLDGAIRLG